MKVDRDNERKTVSIKPETREEASYLANAGIVDILNEYDVEVGGTLVIKKTQWNKEDSIERLDQNSYS